MVKKTKKSSKTSKNLEKTEKNKLAKKISLTNRGKRTKEKEIKNKWATKFGIHIPAQLKALGDKINWISEQLAGKRIRFEATSAKHAIAEGQFLQIAKEEIRKKYGGRTKNIWGTCLKRLAPYDPRTAQRYMQLARYVEMDSPLVSLGQERLHKLIKLTEEEPDEQEYEQEDEQPISDLLKKEKINWDIDMKDKVAVIDLKAKVDNLLQRKPPLKSSKEILRLDTTQKNPKVNLQVIEESIAKLNKLARDTCEQVFSFAETEQMRFDQRPLVKKLLRDLDETGNAVIETKTILLKSAKGSSPETDHLVESQVP